MNRFVLFCTAVLLLGSSVAMADEPAKDAAPNEQEKKLEKLLSGATMVGHFTVTGEEDKSPKEEKYSLQEVRKLKGDRWLFKVRIQYGEHDAVVPLTIPILWAGDTPMVSLTKFPVPGFGTFSARVLFYEDQYAGTWNGGDHGGHLFGRIIPADKAAEAKKDAK